MKKYYPMAYVLDDIWYFNTQHTYESCLTEEKARSVIDVWRNHYNFKIIKAWIDVYEGDEKVDKIVTEYNPKNLYILHDRFVTDIMWNSINDEQLIRKTFGFGASGFNIKATVREVVDWFNKEFPRDVQMNAFIPFDDKELEKRCKESHEKWEKWKLDHGLS